MQASTSQVHGYMEDHGYFYGVRIVITIWTCHGCQKQHYNRNEADDHGKDCGYRYFRQELNEEQALATLQEWINDV